MEYNNHMGKTYNHVLGYMMDDDTNKRLDHEVLEYQKKNPLAKEMKEEEDEDDKLQIFDSAVMDAVLAAKDMYCEDEKSLDVVIDALIGWLKNCKGKEADLKEELYETDEDEEDEGDEETHEATEK